MSSTGIAIIVAVAAAAVLGMLVRPWRTPEWLWAAGGAVILVALRVLPFSSALSGVVRGADVYAFLLGILALAEIAAAAGLFDWVAASMLRAARGRRLGLFALVYGAGVVVTVLLSNDTTVVVLTPAVLAALKRTDVDPLPHLYACAFVANAASFVLPISNPANLVLFGGSLPRLLPWLEGFGLASLAAVVLTFLTLWIVRRTALQGSFRFDDGQVTLRPGARISAMVVAASAVVLVAAATAGWNVGYTALACAVVGSVALAVRAPHIVTAALRRVEFTIVFLVAGLFVIVTALDRAGAVGFARDALHRVETLGPVLGNIVAGVGVTAAANIFNNLPAGLLAGFALQSASFTPTFAHAVVVAIDLGPNLSITGSLATLLWLLVIRRSGITMTPWEFLRTGAIVVTPALIGALLLVR